MKKAIKYFFVFSLLFFLLLSTFQISINKMQCLGSGKISYSLLKVEDCCPPEENKGTTIDTDCCQFSKITFQSSISELLKQEVFKKISVSTTPLFIFVLNNFLFSEKTIPSFFTDTSPPISVGNFLSLLSILQI